MATTEPLTGATVYDNNDQALGGQQIGDVVGDLSPFVIPRFTSTSTRDTAYAAYVAAGGTIKNGMTCWCDSPGSFYDRIAGAWVPRAISEYGTTALDSTAVPATARRVRLRRSNTTTISGTAGAFNIAYGFTFTKLMSVSLVPGDNTGPLGFIVPVTGNHTLTSAHGIAYQPNGAILGNGVTIRVEMDVVGYIL